MATIDGVYRRYLQDNNVRCGTTLENRVAFRLHRWKILEEMQYRVGRYRIDFAWPKQKIALEADGPHHWMPDIAIKDVARDSWLRSHEWLVFRVDDMDGCLEKQLSRVVRIVNQHDELHK
jgi:very-short-patch-repair endonuclease